LGIHADCVENGQQALDAVKNAEQQANQYDLILMDWKMPVMDGIESSKRMQLELEGDVPNILMVSAYDKDEARSYTHETGIKQFLEKPINQSMLVDAIYDLVDGRLSVPISIDEPRYATVPDLSAFTLLLAEDNLVNQQVAKGFLADCKVKVETAETGVIVLEKLRAHPHRYDLVLMDIQMPEMDGLTASREIRGVLKLLDLPIIAMTAHAMAADVDRSFSAGMNDHITKPIDPDVLFETLSNYLTTDKVVSIARRQKHSAKQGIEYDTEHRDLIFELEHKVFLSAASAISKVQGKQTLYLELVNDFYKDNIDTVCRLQSQFKLLQWDQLFTLAHSIKSSASYIGAYPLSEAAQSLESAVKAREDVSLWLDKTVSLFSDLMTRLALVYQSRQVEVMTDVGQRELDITQTKGLIAKLRPLLETSNSQAEGVSQTLLQLSLGTYCHKDIAQLHEQVEDFEFEVALELLNDIERQL
jgi:CheY-like chemotaxis protein/HPt (histidine-containing phosphotransfer) domain-containing protein